MSIFCAKLGFYNLFEKKGYFFFVTFFNYPALIQNTILRVVEGYKLSEVTK